MLTLSVRAVRSVAYTWWELESGLGTMYNYSRNAVRYVEKANTRVNGSRRLLINITFRAIGTAIGILMLHFAIIYSACLIAQ